MVAYMGPESGDSFNGMSRRQGWAECGSFSLPRMDDEDIILTLYPVLGPCYKTTKLSILGNAPQDGTVSEKWEERSQAEEKPDRDDGNTTTRETSAEPEYLGDADDFYRVTFSHGARTSFGFVLGTDLGCDFAIDEDEASDISSYHLAFQFDSEYRLVVRDLSSTCGTSVVYDENDIGRRIGTSWLLNGCQYTEETENIIIQMAYSLQFLVKVPIRDIDSPSYKSKVDRFRQGTNTDAEGLLSKLMLRSERATEQPSNTRTPLALKLRSPALYKKVVGRGGFGKVTHVWNAKTGDEKAVKTPIGLLTPSTLSAWKREADIMSQITHPHIVKFYGAVFNPRLKLSFEYVWGGSLASHLARPDGFSRFETVQVLRQATHVLEYLERMQITHRDISPGNILVSSRDRNGIFIKFADFGLAKAGEELTTLCGTKRYTAPEIRQEWFDRTGDSYTSAVDIWSTGVVIAELLCGLPESDPRNLTWPDEIRDRVENYYSNTNDDLADFLLDSMLVIDPSERVSAVECYQESKLLSDCSNEARGHQGSWSNSKSMVAEESTVRPTVESGPEEATVRPTIEDGICSFTSQAEDSVNQYVTGFQQPTLTQRKHDRKAEVPRPLQHLRGPENSLYPGSVLEDVEKSSRISKSARYHNTTGYTGNLNAKSASEPRELAWPSGCTSFLVANGALPAAPADTSNVTTKSTPNSREFALSLPLFTYNEAIPATASGASLINNLMQNSEVFDTDEMIGIWDAEQEQRDALKPRVVSVSEFGRKRSEPIGELRSSRKRSRSSNPAGNEGNGV
ncbi:Protein kinase-like domain containing protein [Rhypophila decipiens]